MARREWNQGGNHSIAMEYRARNSVVGMVDNEMCEAIVMQVE